MWDDMLLGAEASLNLSLHENSSPRKRLKRIINLHATETKESHSKRIPIHRDLLPMFELLGKIRDLTDDHVFKVNGHKVDVQSCKRPWDRVLDKLKWAKPRPRFHDLRHSWLTNARRSKIDHEMRQAILGHSDRTLPVTERYDWINDKEFVEAIDKLVTFESETIILTAANG
jgi:integrase